MSEKRGHRFLNADVTGIYSNLLHKSVFCMLKAVDCKPVIDQACYIDLCKRLRKENSRANKCNS